MRMTVPTPPGRDILEIKNLRKFFPILQRLMRRVVGHVKAVDDVTFNIHARARLLSLVGESGCGKTTTSALHPARAHAHVGPDSLPHREPDGRRRGHAAQVRAASPAPADADDLPGSLLIAQPRMTIFEIIGEPLLVNGVRSGQTRAGRGNCSAWSTCRRVHEPLSPCVQRRPAPASAWPRWRSAGADRGRRAGLGAGRVGAGTDRPACCWSYRTNWIFRTSSWPTT
ncbi:MAG: hypothetical protein R2838_08660 [Caldilineaceae bacterium]